MRYRQHHRTLSLSLSPVRDTRVWLMYVARNHSMHLALRYWLVILSLSVSLSLSLSLPLPRQAGAADSPPPADVKRVCIFIRGEFQRVTRSKINFPLPCASRFAPPPARYIYLRHKRTLSPPSLSPFESFVIFFRLVSPTFLIHPLYEALFPRPKNRPIPLRRDENNAGTSGTSGFHRKPGMEIAQGGDEDIEIESCSMHER